jgi:hypothetical protein
MKPAQSNIWSRTGSWLELETRSARLSVLAVSSMAVTPSFWLLSKIEGAQVKSGVVPVLPSHFH